MTERYDLIVIGSGPGGASLAHRLAPTGKRILILERGDYLPREEANWSAAGGLRRRPLPGRRDLDQQERRQLQPGASLLRRRQLARSMARRCSACASATSTRSSTRAASRRHGRSNMTPSRPITTRRRRCSTSTGSAARTRSSRRRASLILSRPVKHEPKIAGAVRQARRASASSRSTCRSASGSIRSRTASRRRPAPACAAPSSTAFPAC